MEEDMTGTDVRCAPTRLTDNGPALGFTAAGLVEAGRRRRRQRHAFAVGGAVQVNAIWPDNSGVILTLANQSVTDPAAGAPALTEQQMIDVALRPHS
jgi:hypothetical protein